MEEKSKNMGGNAVDPQENNDDIAENDINELNEDEVNEEEFQALNNQLDELNTVLDVLESKNDNIHAQLMELLKSNKEARKQFQESQQDQNKDNEGTKP